MRVSTNVDRPRDLKEAFNIILAGLDDVSVSSCIHGHLHVHVRCPWLYRSLSVKLSPVKLSLFNTEVVTRSYLQLKNVDVHCVPKSKPLDV